MYYIIENIDSMFWSIIMINWGYIKTSDERLSFVFNLIIMMIKNPEYYSCGFGAYKIPALYSEFAEAHYFNVRGTSVCFVIRRRTYHIFTKDFGEGELRGCIHPITRKCLNINGCIGLWWDGMGFVIPL